MILGKIVGKTTTKNFSFKIDTSANKFQYIQVMHKEYGYILAQIIEIERNIDEIAHCIIIGYKKDNKIQLPRSPLHQDTEVLNAENNLIKDVFNTRKPRTREEINAAVIEAGVRRVRPCLMTTATTILALIPVLTSTGRGADIMIPMAIPTFGGMFFQVGSLLIVPVLYASIAGAKNKWRDIVS